MEKNRMKTPKRRVRASTYGTPDDENPEWTEEDFARARPVKEVMPELIEAAKNARARARGRPKLDHPKQQISIRLDEGVIAGYRALGPGWQKTVNIVLAGALPLLALYKRAESPARRLSIYKPAKTKAPDGRPKRRGPAGTKLEAD